MHAVDVAGEVAIYLAKRWGGCHHVVGNAVNVGVFNGLAVRIKQCVPGVDGVEVAVCAHGSDFNDAVVALVKAGGFSVNNGKDRLARRAWGVAVEEVF